MKEDRVRCNNCDVMWYEDDLEFLKDEYGDWFKACPNCHTDEYLMDTAIQEDTKMFEFGWTDEHGHRFYEIYTMKDDNPKRFEKFVSGLALNLSDKDGLMAWAAGQDPEEFGKTFFEISGKYDYRLWDEWMNKIACDLLRSRFDYMGYMVRGEAYAIGELRLVIKRVA